MTKDKSSSLLIKKIIRHYLKYDKENPFIFISAILAFLGISAGVMVLMVAMGIMNGTQQEFEKKLFVMNYPLTVISLGDGVRASTIKKIKETLPKAKISPFYTTQVISKYQEAIQGGLLYGVDFKKEAKINSIFAKSIDLNKTYSKYSIVAGDDLVLTLGAKKGDKVTLIFSQFSAAGFGNLPLQKRFKLIGSFNSGLNAYDKAIIYTTLDAFVKILKKDPTKFDGVHIYVKNPMEEIKKVKAILPDDADVEGWWQQNGNFFSAMQMEKKALFLVLLMIILVASLNIISSLLMTVMSRRKEIALLRTLGATQKEIKSIFFRLGLIIGAGGVIAGTALGFLIIWFLKNFDIIHLPADVYGTSRLPVDLTPHDFSMIIIGTLLIVILSSLYPAKKAASTDPLSVLRNE
jgi:putative ABC transport system permease protein